MDKILVTGGAGFIGSYTTDLLVDKGYSVKILDNLEPQVHKDFPDYVNPEAEFIRGDVTDKQDWKEALEDIDGIIHNAAMVGVGQSLYQPVRYLKVNTLGTAAMYEVMDEMDMEPDKIVAASSMSCYGEGAYDCDTCGEVHPQLRGKEQMERGEWEVHCPHCDEDLTPIPTHEEKPQHNLSTYALSKYDQERLVLNYGEALDISSVALRYFNVFGPRQSLDNPYTGVAAIFSSRLKNDNPPVIYEDGEQTRDFVYVEDVARANVAALESDATGSFNVGTGEPTSILDVARTLAREYGKDIEPEIPSDYRAGDVRHCYADISKIKEEIGWEPQVSRDEGFKRLVEWGFNVEAEDKFDQAAEELEEFLGD